MKKIGILTFHFADNYGAVLQCYALKKTVDSMIDAKAEIINYIPGSFRYKKLWCNKYEKILFKEKRESFENFLTEHCGIDTSKIYDISEIHDYDCIIVGSDQVWTTDYIDYFLPNLNIRKISYAASLGFYPGDLRLKTEILKKYIPSFSSVSVRESVHIPFIRELCGVQCSCVPDPTLLVDIKSYDSLITIDGDADNYIFFFWLHHDPDWLKGVEFVNALAREYSLNIVHNRNDAKSFTFHGDLGDMQFEGINSFLWYIKNAKYVVTNSYHATIFAMHYEVPFFVMPTDSMKCRFDTLNERFSISDRYYSFYDPQIDFDDKIKWNDIKKSMIEQEEKGKEFLSKALA